MAAVSEFVMHLWTATVSPNDHSGEGVWNQNQFIPVRGTQANESYAFDGVVIQPPDNLSGLHAGVAEIERQKYKCAPTSFFALEHDEQQTFAKAVSREEGKDIIIGIRGFGSDELGRAVNLETRIYWAKLMNSQHLQFGVFAAAVTEVADDRSTVPARYYDYSKGSAKGIESPAGRLTSMQSSPFTSQTLAKGSIEQLNPQMLDF